MKNYRLAYQLVTQAAASCGLNAAEWELYVFQPGNGATALVPGASLPPLSIAKAKFLTANNRAANPRASQQTIDIHARNDARSAAFLMGARPYNMPKAQIERSYPGHFEAFKNACEEAALRIANEVASNHLRNRAWYEDEFSKFLRNARVTYLFVWFETMIHWAQFHKIWFINRNFNSNSMKFADLLATIQLAPTPQLYFITWAKDRISATKSLE